MCEALEAAAAGLLSDMLKAPYGAVRAGVEDAQQPGLADKVWFRRWLTHKKLDFGQAGYKFDDGTLQAQPEDELLRLLEQLQTNLQELSNDCSREVCLVNRLQRGAVLSAAVFDPSEQPDSHAQALREKARARDAMLPTLLQKREEIARMHDTLLRLQRENQALRERNRDTMEALQSLQASATQAAQPLSEAEHSLHRRLESERVRNTILRHIYQALIVASGLDWARDEALQAELLQLENGLGEEDFVQ
eukprot:m.87382 g.87382  ORF g.87382 m.87382 type:complete len:249 (+) comp18017_c0_seq4:36-782(+)